MSDLEEECSSCPDRRCPSEHGKNPDVSLDCEKDWFWPARAIYNAIPIPGELNTKVRAAIESDRKRKDGFMHLLCVGVLAIFGACYIMAHMSCVSNHPSKTITDLSISGNSFQKSNMGWEISSAFGQVEDYE